MAENQIAIWKKWRWKQDGWQGANEVQIQDGDVICQDCNRTKPYEDFTWCYTADSISSTQWKDGRKTLTGHTKYADHQDGPVIWSPTISNSSFGKLIILQNSRDVFLLTIEL